jgi:hypothetical protein
MDFVLTIGTAASATTLLVAMFKRAWATAPSAAIVITALLAGIGLSFLVSAAQGDVTTKQNIATSIIAGIFAAAGAIGIRAADNSSDVRREKALLRQGGE